MAASDYTLLVADDSEENRDILAARLRRAGYRVVTAEDGREALDALAAQSFDLALLDVVMPRATGLDVLRELRQRFSPLELPVIMVTGQKEDAEVVEALALGANDHVAKPVSMPVLLARVEAHLRTREAAAPPRPAPTLEPGAVLAGRYRIGERLGGGEYGNVYRAEHAGVGTPVVVRLPRLRRDAAARFEREALAACRVSSPNVAAVLDAGVAEGVAFLATEWLDGHSLADEIRVSRSQIERVAEVGLPLCGVLAEAHRAGHVHGEVTPGNLFLQGGGGGAEVVKVLDFGLARLAADGVLEPTAGPLPYLAPERIAGNSYDGRADVYGLATVLYEMLAGRTPFHVEGRDKLAWTSSKVSHPPAALPEDLPAPLVAVVMLGLHPDPAERPTADAFGRTLTRALSRAAR